MIWFILPAFGSLGLGGEWFLSDASEPVYRFLLKHQD
jgi:hypothetical protein